MKEVPDTEISEAKHAVAVLWDVMTSEHPTHDIDDVINRVSRLMQSEAASHNNRWDYVLGSIWHALKCWGTPHSVNSALSAADAAYQVVAEAALNRALSRGDGGLIGDEIHLAESENALCRNEIKFQLDALHRIRDGLNVLDNIRQNGNGKGE